MHFVVAPLQGNGLSNLQAFHVSGIGENFQYSPDAMGTDDFSHRNEFIQIDHLFNYLQHSLLATLGGYCV